GEEERLHHPRPRRVGEVRAGDERRVRARRAGRQLTCAREELGRPVLHRAEQPSLLVVVDGAPGAPLVLGLADPLALVDTAPAARLPPDALVAHGRRRLERRARQACDARAHSTASTTTSTLAGSTSAMLERYSRTRACTREPR